MYFYEVFGKCNLEVVVHEFLKWAVDSPDINVTEGNFPGELCQDISQGQLLIPVMKQAVIWEVLSTLISIFRNSRHGILNIDI